MATRKEYHEVTPELINNLITHITVGSLRRACSMATQIIEQAEETACPRLFYALLGGKWEVHAVELDLLRYLMYVDAAKPKPIDPEPIPGIYIQSKMSWDGSTGKTSDGRWSTPVIEVAGKYGTHAIFDGEIKFYQEGEINQYSGNFVGLIIESDVDMLAAYPNAEITFWDTHETYKLSDVSCDGTVSWYPAVRVPGQESRITINWCENLIESFIMMVTQNSTLQYGGEQHNPYVHVDDPDYPGDHDPHDCDYESEDTNES